MTKKEGDKKLKARIFIGLVLIGIMALAGIYNNSFTGNVIIPAETGDPCNESETEYDGSFMEIISPLNNSYTGKTNFNFTVYTDYYGGDIITTCVGEEPQNCTLELISVLISDDGKEIEPVSFELPKTNEGNKTYTSTAAQSSNNYTNGNYTMLTKIKYSCVVANFERDERTIQVDIEEPNITEIYPLNNAVINISTNSTTTIFYKLNATDTVGIANRTISTGSKTISMIQNPNYNETLSPRSYTYTFTAIDLAGNTKSITSSFRIINSSTNQTEPPIENETNETVVNATISFDAATTVNNIITNSSILNIKLIANASSAVNMTFRIYDSTSRIIYQNSTSQKTFNITHTFISDGIYYYNATVVAGDQTVNSATRKITLDTESPTIIITQKTQTVFTNEIILEIKTEDTNRVTRTWINDGAKEFEYTNKINKTLTEGNYTWTIYSTDEAGNTAKEIFRFSIIEEKTTSSTKIIAIILLIVAVILAIILIAMYFLRKNPESNPANPSTMIPPSNSPMQFNRPMPPRPLAPNIPPQTNPAMFKNNPYQR
jgi:hypothetical protein